MGSDLSSCCSVETAADKQIVPEAPKAISVHSRKSTAKPKAPTPQQPDVGKFTKILEAGMEVTVLLADGTELACTLQLNLTDQSLAITCDKNLRQIPLKDLRAILHGKDQLKRVETKARLMEDFRCVALHMTTGNCIPIRFAKDMEKEEFVLLVKKLKQ